jgi:peptidoglycan/LPS O-acetylase OafA/YrhL
MSSNPSQKNSASRIVFLDYLRVFAFVSVLIGHKFAGQINSFINDPAAHATPKLLMQVLTPFFHGGGAGVVVFFLISGYIITHVLCSEGPAEFAIKRFFRIYPLYWLAVAGEVLLSGASISFSEFLCRLLLIGDFTGTPYGLAGVEWTLRVEVVFYAIMGLLKAMGLFGRHQKLRPFALGLITFIWAELPAFPMTKGLFAGYFTIYAPFLFLGSFVYLCEKREVSRGLLGILTALVLIQYFSLIELYQPRWRSAHFATIGVGVFFAGWWLRGRLSDSSVVRFLSELTFSVYLFHNWLWSYLKQVLEKVNISLVSLDLQIVCALLLVCLIATKTVERSGVSVGKVVVAWARERRARALYARNTVITTLQQPQ